MANSTSKPPKHDFAPAWLKVPDKEAPQTPRKAGGKTSDEKALRAARRDDYYNGFNRHDYYPALPRQHSFEYYEDRRYSPQKYRHHSVDDDYYSGAYGCYGAGGGPVGYYDGYYDKYGGPGGGSGGGGHYRSYPGGLYGDSKYTHPNARYGNAPHPGAVPTGGYPPQYYDPYMHDYYHGEAAYYGGYMRSGGKRRGGEKDGRRPGGAGRGGEKRAGSRSKESSVDDDFPCLSGDVGVEKKSGRCSSLSSPVGVWASKVSAAKVVNGNATDAGSHGTRNESGEQFTSLNKKAGSTTSESSGLKGPMEKLPKTAPASIKDINSNSERAKPTNQTPPKDGADLVAKEGDVASSVRQVAPLQNGELGGGEDALTHDLHDLSMSAVERNLMSDSSIEAEQRLLKQMGWDEADDEDYVITEDELREFQKLKQMKPGRNGLSRPAAPVWSPQHLAPGPVPLAAESPCSSSDDDSDLD